ncbi:IclR family transcriptional regulator [Arthrobacter sp. CJ23]|uniref:IclR family transcriptional regulator n=1 Tax=Arthrobacter sp. CJ23 TaxID=2972479 RepID=UPI00215D3371|nr:IclR family transcriptional regulator [Arthrobacter sp. CJ23]UVJ41372.1 IclR family transcriptional regulator [Arthrobacter sp. CJ23]
MIRNEDSSRVEAVHRALVLLKLMAEKGSLSVTEAAKELDVNPSTAQRLLATLVGDGFARQGNQKRYSPGPEFLRPGMMQPIPPLRLRVRPYLERLSERVGETVHLATLVGTEIHHLDGIEATTHALRFGLRTGVVLPAHVTSAGKAMLADLTPQEVDARYKIASAGSGRRDMKIDPARIHADLEKTRRAGVGANYEESEGGVAALAVSLGVIDGEHAALSVALPIARFTREDARRLASCLVQTAKEFKEHETSAAIS